MRRTEHLSGGVAWPARDLYLADDGECPACRKTFDGVEPTTALVCCATAICRTCLQACLRRAQSDSRFACPLCKEDFVNDPEKCLERLEAHVEADSPFAIEMLACMHQQGRLGLAQNSREAARLFRRAAKLGKPRANVRLGLLKLEGCRGVRQDEAGALAAFLNAAKAGDAYGQYLAGRLLLDAGEARRAIVLWEAAADQGLGAAAAALGAIHDHGEGVPRSLARAAIWYTEAENHGDEIAAERLEELRAETRDIFKGMRFV